MSNSCLMTCWLNRAVGQAIAFGFNSSALTAGPLRSRLIRPFLTITRPSDSRRWGRWTTPTLPPFAGSPRFLCFSFPTRCLQSPRGACRLRSSVASPTVAGFVLSGRLAAPTLCNEAESSLLSLRLAGSPHRASPWGLLLSAPDWLHVGHLFDMLITFQINRFPIAAATFGNDIAVRGFPVICFSL